MRLRFKIGLFTAVMLWAFLQGRGCAKPTPTVVLPPGDTEQIRVDPNAHRGIIVTPQGTRTFTLPDRQSVIDIHKDGSVSVTAPQLGLETHPFVGLGYGQGLRIYLGADLAYWKKADLGIGVSLPSLLDRGSQNFNDFRVGLFGSYNFYSNTRVSLGIDQQKTVHLLLSVRI